MNEQIKSLWLAALRSGEYQQTQQYLRATNKFTQQLSYCCLGVLCDLYQQETQLGSWDVWDRFVIGSAMAMSCFPMEVQKWAGLDIVDESMLIAHNDDQTIDNPMYDDHDRFSDAFKIEKGLSFKKIAQLIEEYL